jgi:hypothetical protein
MGGVDVNGVVGRDCLLWCGCEVCAVMVDSVARVSDHVGQAADVIHDGGVQGPGTGTFLKIA